MTSAPKYAGLIVKLRSGSTEAFAATARRELGLDLLPLLPNATAARALGAAPAEAEWAFAPLADGPQELGGWEEAHRALERAGAGAAPSPVLYAEPDLLQEFPAFPPERQALAAAGGNGRFDDQDRRLPCGPGFAWHLSAGFADLAAARDAVGVAPVRILHVDTGYDPLHGSVPEGLLAGFARDFEGGGERRGAADPGEAGLLKQPGHGTATLALVAGNRVDALGHEYLGGAPHAEVIPVRIATSVVLFRTSALARALDYALRPYDGPDAAHPGATLPPVDVVTLSMGGLASRAWADAVNAAYQAGVCLVAAAGNNFAVGPLGLPTRFIVYPARFRRVLAACGVMADRRPYFGLPTGTMQGCWGPPSKMATAMAAFTPNVPWAEMGAPAIVDMNGAGTSSATPQIAAAAALWLAHHRAALEALPARWQRVEAVRHALLGSAEPPSEPAVAERIGRGILQARAALAVAPRADLPMTPPDSAGLALFKVLTGLGLAQTADPRLEMLAVEASQLAQLPAAPGQPNPFEGSGADPDGDTATATTAELLALVNALRGHPRASRPLRDHLDRVRSALGAGRPAPPAPPAPSAPSLRARPGAGALPAGPPRLFAPPRPLQRQLAAFAFDPSVAQRLETRDIGTITLRLPWEPLAPGPVGEYVEVIDVDPACRCWYAPVDLDHPHLLAQGGLPPTVGAPQFHQQMAYAVAMSTIVRFEQALGRKALWAPHGEGASGDGAYVPRLRIYPHALREANAYYSPPRKALLLGYFRASSTDPGDHLPGGFVFTALSQDIVAHETAHALLDGMHRRFSRPTNPDMQAFHEAFADVVALLQHFTSPEIVRDQVARTRGELRNQASLLGELASEFGRAMGERQALRDYIGRFDERTGAWMAHQPDPREYEEAVEPHARGAILVSAVFDAFLSIYERRTRDLLRIATDGTGVLRPGAIHPDLAGRLAEEAARTADQTLRMCIRALDYCPPVDLTFGEYLRAVITADQDLVKDDDLGYRVAFVEAFRRRAIYPRNVRTLSEDALLWRGLPTAEEDRPSRALLDVFASLRHHARGHLEETSRELLFHRERALRAALHGQLSTVLRAQPPDSADARLLGLELAGGRGFEVHSARFADRVGPDGQLVPQCIVELLQEKEIDRPPVPGAPAASPAPGRSTVRVEGGATVVVSLREGGRDASAVRYVIRKSLGSPTRLARQLAFHESHATGVPWNTYFGMRAIHGGQEPFAAVHRS